MIKFIHEDYELLLMAEPRLLPSIEQLRLLEIFDRIVQTAWEVDPFIYRKEPDFFHNGDFGVVFIYRGAEIVGCSIYKRLRPKPLDLIIYRYVTVVHRAHQGHGLYQHITELIYNAEQLHNPLCRLYTAWRTRNPKVWSTLARQCVTVDPQIFSSELNDELRNLNIWTASTLYPGLELDTTTMLMPNAYSFLKYREKQNYYDATISAYFNDLAPNCALFSLGEVARPL
ncbi:GNAT family protein [Achromobacter xylosoxidans]|uniref:hypothetical protein n=1 Tax=Alcaligenes xylosoxydans xylosoxydans TaxID=85698 RepID=UPI0010611AE7|nr:hypothetical protein [Achromobacter xylosoxidans]BEG75477.1 hypothetical protein HBIAX_02542 [Achromobacter xylosoxidans]